MSNHQVEIILCVLLVAVTLEQFLLDMISSYKGEKNSTEVSFSYQHLIYGNHKMTSASALDNVELLMSW